MKGIGGAAGDVEVSGAAVILGGGQLGRPLGFEAQEPRPAERVLVELSPRGPVL